MPAAAAKILKDLHERKEIEGRAAGKQIVYHTVQNPNDAISPEQLSAMDAQITQLRTDTVAAQATAKTLRSTLSSLNSTLSTSDLVSSVSTLEAERQDILARLENLKEGNAKKVTKTERDAVDKEWVKWKDVAGRREKISNEMWKLIEDVLPEGVTKGELRESLGLDE